MTCGSHGRGSAPVDAEALEAVPETRRRALPPRRPRRRGRPSRRSGSRGSARAASTAGASARAAASRSALDDRLELRRPACSPRNASVTCRFSGRDEPGVRRRRRARCACQATSRSTASRRERRAKKSRRRSSPSTLAVDFRANVVPDCVKSAPQHVQSQCGRPAADRLAVAGELEARARRRRPGPSTARKTSPTGFSGVPPSGPAMPVTATATSAPSAARAPAAIAAAVSADTAPCSRSTSARHAELPLLDLVRVRDHAADEDVARARDVGQPRADEPARARLGRRERQARVAAERRARSPRPAARRRGEEVVRERGSERFLERGRRALGAWLDERGRRGSRSRGRRPSPRARSPLRPPPRARARPPTRSGRRSGGRGARRPGPRERGAHRRGSRARSARAAAAPPAARAARPRRGRSCSRRTAGAVPASPSETAPSGSDACLRTPAAKSAYGRRSRSATPRETPSISRCELLVDAQRRGRSPRASSSTVRSSCVGPRPPERMQRSAAEPSRERRRELLRAVADDDDPRRLEAEARQLLRRGTARSRSRRSPRTSSLPVTTTTARGAGAVNVRGRDASRTPFAVATTIAGLAREVAARGRPLSSRSGSPERRASSQSFFSRRSCCVWPASSVPS